MAMVASLRGLPDMEYITMARAPTSGHQGVSTPRHEDIRDILRLTRLPVWSKVVDGDGEDDRDGARDGDTGR